MDAKLNALGIVDSNLGKKAQKKLKHIMIRSDLSAKLKAPCLFVFLLLLVSTMGCIHVDFGNPFKKPEPKITGLDVVHKEGFPLTHIFKFDEGDSIQYSETQPFYIYKGTEWINISIIVTINSYNFINNSPINLSILERYVEIKLIDPEDKVPFRQKYIESTDRLVPVSLPTAGRWIVSVEAKGFGFEGTYDSYSVDVITYEPV
jgi:hypothetical protein